MLEPTRNSRLQKCQEKEVTKADDTNKRIMEGVLENYSAPVSVTGNGHDKQAGGGKDQVSQVYTSTTRLLFMHYAGVLCHVCSVWPFAIQSGFSVPSIGIIVVSYGSFTSWLILARFYPADLSKAYKVRISDVKMKESVHLMSVHCLVAQATGTTGCLVASCLYLWNIREVVD